MLEFYQHIIVMGMLMARVFGIAIILPVFTRAQIGNPVRAGFAIALILPILPIALESFEGPAQFSNLELSFIVAKELVIGVIMGLLLSFPFWAVQATGELIDSQRGAAEAAFEEPGGQDQLSVTSSLLAVLSITLFVSADGLQHIATILYKSYDTWPLLDLFPKFDDRIYTIIEEALDYIFKFGFTIAGPFILIFFLVDFIVASIGRFAPKIASFDLTYTIKNFIFCILIFIYSMFFIEYVGVEVGSISSLDQKMGFN